MSNTIRASVVQACTAAYSLPDTLDKLERLVKVAKDRDGSQIAVFPEAFIGGYPKMSTFGAVVGERSPEGREEFLRYHQAAIELPSPALTRIEAIGHDNDIFLVVGIIERDGGTLYCTVIFVDPHDGFFTSGDSAVKAKLSATICWENYMPLLRTFYYSKGTQLYCAPTVDARPVWQHTMTHIALEGRCFVLAACQYAQEKDYPPDHAVANANARNGENVMIAGGSVIVNPLGRVLAGPLLEGEGVLTAELDLDDIVRGKYDFDVTGHYARNDIFELRVNAA
ncbi:carbon-nitrogen hydrolase [Amylostereum chailletii]|nr:carbon-nitrogen hydrolase [Amylostereum chailletii]